LHALTIFERSKFGKHFFEHLEQKFPSKSNKSVMRSVEAQQ